MSTQTAQAAIIEAGEGRKLNVLGHAVTVRIPSANTNGDSWMFEVISPPGMAVPPHVHEYEDEYGYIIEGVWEIILDGQIYEATAGAVVHCPRHTSHGFRNIGSTTGKMLWISTPGAAVERFFEELGALPADAPPDMEKIAGIFAKYSIGIVPAPSM